MRKHSADLLLCRLDESYLFFFLQKLSLSPSRAWVFGFEMKLFFYIVGTTKFS